MSECLGAGTGCGWCIPFLIKIAEDPDAFNLDNVVPEAYAKQRKDYISAQPKNTFQTSQTEHSREEIGSPSERGAPATG
jgi:NAD(P)H-nitrite reductase large subunit